MDAPSSSATPMSGFVSKTPKQAPSSFRLSPPPLKQNRLPRHLAIPIEGTECNGPIQDNGSSLISIMHGHELTTPRNFSLPMNFMPSIAHCLAENPEDSTEHRVDDNPMADDIADFEVAMFSCISRGHRERLADQRTPAAAAAAAQITLESRKADSSAPRPFFPSNDEFSMSPLDRQRFALLPKINLFQERY